MLKNNMVINLKIKGKIRIDLGCGNNKKKGFIGFDIKKNSAADYVYNLAKGIPLPDNSVDELYTSHFLEHLDDHNHMMKEMIRVCKNGTRIEIVLPYYSYIGATLHSYIDNPHKHVFSEAYFYWKDVNPCFQNYDVERVEYKTIKYGICRWRSLRDPIFYFVYNYLISDEVKRRHFLNSVEEFRVILRVKK